jgi:gamma-glutamyltranspeptidase/glutathione hydrolase
MAQWTSDRTPVGLYDAVERTESSRRRFLHDDRSGGTSVVTAADIAGNAIVLVHSNSYQRYGSGIVVPPYGLVLSNRAGRGFSPDPNHPNFCAEGRRPGTTLHAWAVGRKDETGVGLMGATPGGENQMRWNAQVLADVFGGDEDPGSLVSRPRWGKYDNITSVEQSHDLAISEPPHGDTTIVPDYSLRSSLQIVSLGEPCVTAGADPRTAAASRSW